MIHASGDFAPRYFPWHLESSTSRVQMTVRHMAMQLWKAKPLLLEVAAAGSWCPAAQVVLRSCGQPQLASTVSACL